MKNSGINGDLFCNSTSSPFTTITLRKSDKVSILIFLQFICRDINKYSIWIYIVRSWEAFSEVIIQMAVYTGFPSALNGIAAAIEAFVEHDLMKWAGDLIDLDCAVCHFKGLASLLEDYMFQPFGVIFIGKIMAIMSTTWFLSGKRRRSNHFTDKNQV